MKTILVAGTDAWADDGTVDWYWPGSPFADFLARQRVDVCFNRFNASGQPKPFVWSTGLAGVPFLTRKHVQWAAGGEALFYFATSHDIRGKDLGIIAHSHGLQVVLYACAEENLKIQTLISVGSPIREDMMDVARRARPNIATWLHLHSDETDRWQWLGELFDGGWRGWFRLRRIVREHPLADRNVAVAGVGHSGLLLNPQEFHRWVDGGWLSGLLRESLT